MKTIELGDRDVETLTNALAARLLYLKGKIELPDTTPTDKIKLNTLCDEAVELLHRIHFIS